MSAGLFPWAFAAGTAAALNPCGFAVLPAYLAYQLGHEGASGAAAVLRGVGRGLLMTAGVLSLFILVGWAMGTIRAALLPVLPWLAVLVGVLLMVLGALLLTRRSMSLELAAATRFAHVGSGGRAWLSTYLFGVGYGVASLGCTLPIFLAISAQSLATRSLGEALAVFLAYGAGMGWIIILASAAVAVGNTIVVRLLRSLMGRVRAAGAVAMIAAGGYLVYFYRAVFGGAL
jgi:cytochrome c biogenesis protein CcdA